MQKMSLILTIFLLFNDNYSFEYGVEPRGPRRPTGDCDNNDQCYPYEVCYWWKCRMIISQPDNITKDVCDGYCRFDHQCERYGKLCVKCRTTTEGMGGRCEKV